MAQESQRISGEVVAMVSHRICVRRWLELKQQRAKVPGGWLASPAPCNLRALGPHHLLSLYGLVWAFS